jgi:hypothetical protein
MRKRTAARPVLESMEDRLVLSGAGALDPTAQLRSALTALFAAHHSRAASAHHSRSEVPGQQHHTTKTVHAVHHQSSTSHHSSTSSGSGSLSNFFKSVFPGL